METQLRLSNPNQMLGNMYQIHQTLCILCTFAYSQFCWCNKNKRQIVYLFEWTRMKLAANVAYKIYYIASLGGGINTIHVSPSMWLEPSGREIIIVFYECTYTNWSAERESIPSCLGNVRQSRIVIWADSLYTMWFT